MPAYLEDLTIRLATGLGQLDEGRRERHANFFRSMQRADGGFRGRSDESDLYYTGFALRGLALLGELGGATAERATEFLARQLGGNASVVDFLSLVYSGRLLEMSTGHDAFAAARADWARATAEMLESLRRDDGGYAKGPEGAAGSTYHSFLVVLCRQLIDAPLIEPQRLAEFVLSQRREDGGFVEIRAMRRSGTNPTAAAIGLLKILDRLNDEVREDAIDFLLDLQTDEGGLRANTRIPIADLLSTFTGLLTLEDLGARFEVDRAELLGFVESLELPQGGFHGAAWDEGVDVEYTFYGLGALALLQDV
ncbi:MAG: geranyl transferase [Planctomycetales bacterium]|nr:geranyl transferase [Planctomycetales bacterium]